MAAKVVREAVATSADSGHFARECPKKGFGKGGGKAMGSTTWQPPQWPKGGGKGAGETRACYNCGKTGHLSQDCFSQRQVNEGIEESQGPEALFIGDVSVYQKTTTVAKKKTIVDEKLIDRGGQVPVRDLGLRGGLRDGD